MPLEARDVTWTETESFLTLKVPLNGVKSSDVDIVTSDEYIKVSFPPYLYEAFLYNKINEQESKLKIENGLATFVLLKREECTWGQLMHIQAKDQHFQKTKREEAWEYNKEKQEKYRVDRLAEIDQQKKFAVKEQIRLEQEERQKLKEIKELEKNIALAKMQEPPISCNGAYNGQSHEETGRETAQSKGNTKEEIFQQDEVEEEQMALPAPRSTGTIQVSFTPRVFPTPSRESKAPEEEAWLEKVAAMNKMKSNEDAVDIEEMNPVWLKQKGDGFYKQGNFVAAINAYTAAIVLDGAIPSLYSNRAACHLQMKQYRETIQDCSMMTEVLSKHVLPDKEIHTLFEVYYKLAANQILGTTKALELLTPPVPANADARCRAYVRRGTAHFEMEAFVEALKDYEAGLAISPKMESLRSDADRIRAIIQGTC